jgi:hypothetical protein
MSALFLSMMGSLLSSASAQVQAHRFLRPFLHSRNREGIMYESKAVLTCTWETIPEHILIVKRTIGIYNEKREGHI